MHMHLSVCFMLNIIIIKHMIHKEIGIIIIIFLFTFKHVDVSCNLSSYSTCECFKWVILHFPHSVSCVEFWKLDWSDVFLNYQCPPFNYLVMMHFWSDSLVFPLPAGEFLYCTYVLFLNSIRNIIRFRDFTKPWSTRSSSKHSVPNLLNGPVCILASITPHCSSHSLSTPECALF